jgi:hypothetical protein
MRHTVTTPGTYTYWAKVTGTYNGQTMTLETDEDNEARTVIAQSPSAFRGNFVAAVFEAENMKRISLIVAGLSILGIAVSLLVRRRAQ